MVHIRNGIFEDCNYNKYFEQFNFELSDFQKWSIKSIVDGNHSLVTAHTGSGKTVPAEFAIEFFHSQGKKVIYTTPIKALSNQKLYDLKAKYPQISFGILTGDSKDNPEADVLIMTTEILRNTLLKKKIIKSNNVENNIPLQFELDIDNDLGAVVFDEIHYIADEDRGQVWEQSILLLPPKVQLIMLSATINKPENFASWIENEKKNQGSDKIVVLSSTSKRVVPLTHYSWLCAPKGVIKKGKGTKMEKLFASVLGEPIILKTPEGVIDENIFNKLSDIKNFFQNESCRITRSFVLNQLVLYLYKNDMLPALCFVFSRKQVEECANELNIQLFEEDSNIPFLIEKECKNILVQKISNYKEYIELPEYRKTIELLQKGIAIHHAGVMPILREMIEILFEKGYIKILFATETFAVGINMPTKTVIFSKLTKWDGRGMRELLPNEYTQMAGRAGRRGIDKVGHVFHCNNLFTLPDINNYKKILVGAPKEIKSQFKISYHIILNIISSQVDKTRENILIILKEFMEQSMIQNEISQDIQGCQKQIITIEKNCAIKHKEIQTLNTSLTNLENYNNLLIKIKKTKGNQQKKIRKELKKYESKNNSILQDIEIYKKYLNLKEEVNQFNTSILHMKEYIQVNIQKVIDFLIKNNFILEDEDKYLLSSKGIIATHIQEIHCLAIADLYEQLNSFEDLSVKELIGLFSCFTNISLKEEFRLLFPKNFDYNLQNALISIKKNYEKYITWEEEENLNMGGDATIHFDIIHQVMEWCDCENEEQCNTVLHDIKWNKEIFLGEFIKAILKINNIASEFENICEILNNMVLLKKIQEISTLTMKYIATNQSLYI